MSETDKEGNSLLHEAAKQGSPSLARVLLAEGGLEVVRTLLNLALFSC